LSKIVNILYSGLGGHGNVVNSIITADKLKRNQYSSLYYGIENLNPDYEQFCKKNNVRFLTVMKKKGLSANAFIKVYSGLKRLDPDIILCHSMTVIWIACLFSFVNGKKIFAIEHNSNQVKSNKEWACSLFALLFAKKTVYLTEYYQNQVSQKFWHTLVKRNSVVIKNGLDLEKFTKHSKGIALEPALGMQSRFTPLRDHNTLIQAFKTIKTTHPLAKLYLAGSGETVEQVKQFIHANGLDEEVKLMGTLNEDELIDFLSSLSVYIHSSLAETQSTAILQAMAMSLPLIATNISGINNMIEENQNGLLFEPGNANQLSEKIMSILNTENLKSKLSTNARAYVVKNHSDKTMFDEYTKLICE
jgi:glycosyltransferase involved in cell wall biosynthesis